MQLLSTGRVFADLFLGDEEIGSQPILEWLRGELDAVPERVKQDLKAVFPTESEQLVKLLDNPTAPISTATLDGLVNALLDFRLSLDRESSRQVRWRILFGRLMSDGLIGEGLKAQLVTLCPEGLLRNSSLGDLAAADQRRGYGPEQMKRILSVSSGVKRDNMDAIHIQPRFFDILSITGAYIRDPVKAFEMYKGAPKVALTAWGPADDAKRHIKASTDRGDQYRLNLLAWADLRRLDKLLGE